MDTCLEVLNSVNQCQIDRMEKVGRDMDPSQQGSFETFSQQVQQVQAAIIHTFQVAAYLSLHEPEPSAAAMIWKQVSRLCDHALAVLRQLRDKYPDCGTPQLNDLALDYRIAADNRYNQNLEDSQCKTTPPVGLFPTRR